MQNWLLDVFNTNDLVEAISVLSFRTVAIATVLLIALLLIATLIHERKPNTKAWLFGAVTLVVLSATTVLIGSTVYLNRTSSSGGPVHWHADFEVWACGEELDLLDPQGALSNKVGTPVLHEHNDKRIHLEGVVVEQSDASLGKFLEVVGGSITDDSLVVPTNIGVKRFTNGQLCDGQPAELQAFVYQATDDGYYRLIKLDSPARYIIRDESVVPPGDCIIIEFDAATDTTDKMCLQYKVALDIGKLHGRAE